MLDVAEELVQRRGFNGFSYADVARELGITTASLHYHFAGKEDLGKALIARYSARFFAALGEIEASVEDSTQRLRAYFNLYADVLRKDRLCLCGMLAAEFRTLPELMQAAVISFFETNEKWLAKVLDAGREQNALHFSGSPTDEARMIVGSLEGAMLVTRPLGDMRRFQAAADQLLTSLSLSRQMAEHR